MLPTTIARNLQVMPFWHPDFPTGGVDAILASVEGAWRVSQHVRPCLLYSDVYSFSENNLFRKLLTNLTRVDHGVRRLQQFEKR